jgi:hypothetical protein
MTAKDGRNATTPYRVRVAGTWYWVDPTVPPGSIEPGDTVLVYSAGGEAHLAVLQSPFTPATDEIGGARPVVFSSLEGEPFALPARAVAALHLAALDEQQ